MLLKACGKEVTFTKLFAVLLSGYFVNQALPRVGELVRSYLLNRSDKISYGTSIGSVVAERLIDTICLALLLISCLVFIHDISFAFFESHIHLPLQNYFGELPFWKIGALLLGITALLYFIIERSQKKNKSEEQSSEQSQSSVLDEFADESWQGMAAVTKVESKVLFWAYTILIWVLYFLMTYLWFFSLEETKHLGIKEAVFIWAIGNIGRMVPTQGGGAGAYHYLVIQAFLLFGISTPVAGAMALLIHGLQTCFYLLVGSISLVAFTAFTSRETLPQKEVNTELN